MAFSVENQTTGTVAQAAQHATGPGQQLTPSPAHLSKQHADVCKSHKKQGVTDTVNFQQPRLRLSVSVMGEENMNSCQESDGK